MKTTFIYALLDPTSEEVRYVGKSNSPYKRLKEHISNKDKDSTRKTRWINQLLSNGKTPKLLILEEVLVSSWREAEQKWIKAYPNLTNLTLGGDGVTSFQEESKEKLRASLKERYKNPEFIKQQREKLWDNPTWREKVSSSTKGKSRPWVKDLPQNQKGRNLSKSTKQKISESLIGNKRRLGIPHTDEVKERCRLAAIGNPSRKGQIQLEEERKKKSEALKGRKVSEETREKMRLARINYWNLKRQT